MSLVAFSTDVVYQNKTCTDWYMTNSSAKKFSRKTWHDWIFCLRLPMPFAAWRRVDESSVSARPLKGLDWDGNLLASKLLGDMKHEVCSLPMKPKDSIQNGHLFPTPKVFCSCFFFFLGGGLQSSFQCDDYRWGNGAELIILSDVPRNSDFLSFDVEASPPKRWDPEIW